MVSHIQGKEDAFLERKKKVGRAMVNRLHGLPLDESLSGKKSPSSSPVISGCDSSPLWFLEST